MKIAFDGQLLLDKNKTGIAWVAHNLIMELAKISGNECVIRCFKRRKPGSAEVLEHLQEYVEAGCKIEHCTWFHRTLYKFVWLVLPVPYWLFFPSHPDIAQFFNYAVPPGVRGRSVTFIYDMAYLDCPETVRPKTKWWLKLCMKKTCKNADQIVTGSTFSKARIHMLLHIPQEKIAVVPDAVDHSTYHAGYSETQICSVLEQYDIQREYILYLGTIEPRKNIENLVLAYEKLCQRMKDAPQLVLAGGRGWLCDRIYQAVRELELARPGKIRCTGYVDQNDVPVLMCGARIFVFPSLYEGFGMPPLEAMACGTPVVVSRTSSLPEVVGEAGVLVNPLDTDEICEGMKRLLTDEEYWNRMREAGLKRAGLFTWESSAGKLMDVYRRFDCEVNDLFET